MLNDINKLLGLLDTKPSITCRYCGRKKTGNFYKVGTKTFCKKVCLRKYCKENNIKCDYCKGILTDDCFIKGREDDLRNFCSMSCCMSQYEMDDKLKINSTKKESDNKSDSNDLLKDLSWIIIGFIILYLLN